MVIFKFLGRREEEKNNFWGGYIFFLGVLEKIRGRFKGVLDKQSSKRFFRVFPPKNFWEILGFLEKIPPKNRDFFREFFGFGKF